MAVICSWKADFQGEGIAPSQAALESVLQVHLARTHMRTLNPSLPPMPCCSCGKALHPPMLFVQSEPS